LIYFTKNTFFLAIYLSNKIDGIIFCKYFICKIIIIFVNNEKNKKYIFLLFYLLSYPKLKAKGLYIFKKITTKNKYISLSNIERLFC